MSTGSDALGRKDPRGKRSKGGTAVAIKKDITHKRLNIRTTIQVVALAVYLIEKGKRTVFSIYLPPLDQMTEEVMRDLIFCWDISTHTIHYGKVSK